MNEMREREGRLGNDFYDAWGSFDLSGGIASLNLQSYTVRHDKIDHMDGRISLHRGHFRSSKTNLAAEA